MRRPPPAARRVATLLLGTAGAVLVAASLSGCRGGEEPLPEERSDDLQTVDVAPPPDARVDPSTDRQERRRAETFSGVMPAGYPTSLPMPMGASLVDQGPSWVELLVGRPLPDVRQEYLRRAREAGWRVEGAGGPLQLGRQGQVVRVHLSAAGPSTRLRIEY